MMKHRRLTTLVFAVLAATPLAGHAQAGDDKGPIVVGAVSSLTGAGASDASTQAAQLVFNAVNAAGGIQGRPIAYRVIDDQMNPVKAQEAAQALVNDPRVVALAGGSSVLECAVNHARYAQAGLFSLPGAGVDPVCFSATHIAPLNAGPYASTANALTFASKVLRHQTICVVSPALPGMTEAFKKTVLEWAQRASVTAPTLDVYQLDDPLPPLVQRVAARGCQVVVYTGPGGPAVGWVLASRPFMPKVPVVMLTSAYTSQAAKALEAVGQGIYAMAEFDPWSSGTLQIMNWRRLLIARQVEPSSLSQGGHIAAQALVHTLQGIKGPIHRANVAKALETMAPWRSGMTHQAFRVGAQGKHELNRSALPMRLDGDRWRIAHPEWISN